MPSTGSNTNAAAGGPHMAPPVFHIVSQPAVRVATPTWRCKASPSSVNRTPESSDGSNVRTEASHRTRYHDSICVPAVSPSNAA